MTQTDVSSKRETIVSDWENLPAIEFDEKWCKEEPRLLSWNIDLEDVLEAHGV